MSKLDGEEEKLLEWQTGLAGVQSYALVDELVRRGFKTEIRRHKKTRNTRLVLVSSWDYDSQGTGKP